MQALRFENFQLRLAEFPPPRMEGEALIRVLKSGICNTDLEIVRGYAGFEGTIGHEFVGIVEESSDAKSLIGKRVVGEINVGCGVCKLCVGGDSRHCPFRTVLGILGRDGAHAEFLTLPTRNLVEVPPDVPNEEAVFVEPLAAACAILEQVEINVETRIAVIGDGKLGLLCAQVLALYSDEVFLVGKHRDKMLIAVNRGVQGVMLNDAEKLARDFDVAIEASGSAGGFKTALQLIRPRGKLVLKSTFHGDSRWDTARVVVDEITIVGSRCGRFAPALELLRDKRVDVSNLISDDLRLAKGIEAMKRAKKKNAMKVLLTP